MEIEPGVAPARRQLPAIARQDQIPRFRQDEEFLMTITDPAEYRRIHDIAAAAYEAAVPVDYRYSALALRKAVDAALSALAPQAGDNAEEPYRWIWEEDLINSGTWDDMYDDEPPSPHDRIRNVRPLYLHPCAPALEDKGGDGDPASLPTTCGAGDAGYLHRLKTSDDWNISLPSQMATAWEYQRLFPDQIEIIPLLVAANPTQHVMRCSTSITQDLFSALEGLMTALVGEEYGGDIPAVAIAKAALAKAKANGASGVAGVRDTLLPCPCTLIEQDETCPVGYPSLLCEECDGKGHLLIRPPIDAIKRLRAYATGSNDVKFDTYDAADVIGYLERLSPPPSPEATP
jgi:hypothetical protein